jgi:UDP-N-acetylglucosamine acyltransferase
LAWQAGRNAHLGGVIHASAIVHPKAQVDPTVRIGPYAVIDEGVEIGPECDLGPYVYVTGLTCIGRGNRFFAGCVIGEAPQDLKYKGEPAELRIGDRNTFREHVTVHRSNHAGDATLIGSGNYLMQHSHVAHNVVFGDSVILAGGALVAGHASVGDFAFISGNCLVHQFVRIGTHALMQGGSAISKDLPPYLIARGGNGICGLNTIGLRRAGFTAADRLELKQLYRLLFRSGLNVHAAAATARQQFSSAPARIMLDFIAASKRGVCSDAGRPMLLDADEATAAQRPGAGNEPEEDSGP